MAKTEQSSGARTTQHPRVDLQLISRLVERGSRVLDLGCGDGELMELLVKERGARATGVEISEEGVYACIARGLPVHHADLDEGLDDYPDGSFDYVILSQTLQAVRKPREVLREMLRVGRLGIVSFPNFGHWSVRWELMRTGRMPKTRQLPYEWHNTPNIHLATVRDFEDLCRREAIRIKRATYLAGGKRVTFMPNLRAELAVFVVERR
jgi:methionine biosynthesis protein MetW